MLDNKTDKILFFIESILRISKFDINVLIKGARNLRHVLRNIRFLVVQFSIFYFGKILNIQLRFGNKNPIATYF